MAAAKRTAAPPPHVASSDVVVNAAAADLRMVLSFNLRMARTAVRMTQRDLSKASGVSQKHISAIELAPPGVNIGIDVLAALAHGLGIPASDLLTPPATRRPK